MSVKQNLKQVRYYMPQDPYTSEVDNRPLRDLGENIDLVATAIDNSAGAAARASLSNTALAYSLTGGEGYIGDFIASNNSLQLDFTFGYGIFMNTVEIDGIDTPVPTLSVHDRTTRFTDITPAANPGNAVKYLIQGKSRPSRDDDRVSSSDSAIEVLSLSVKNSNEYPVSGAEPSLSPDIGAIPLLEITVPYGTNRLDQATIKRLRLKTIDRVSDVPATVKIDYLYHTANISSGNDEIALSSSGLDLTNMTAVEVFLDGVNQFEWTFNSGNSTIKLAEAVVSDATVRIRQTVLIQP